MYEYTSTYHCIGGGLLDCHGTQGVLDGQMRLVCFAAKRLALIESSPEAKHFLMAAVAAFGGLLV